MAGISLSALSPAASMLQPRLRLVGRSRHLRAIAQTPDESQKTAVMACLVVGSSRNAELLRKAAAYARDHRSNFYAVIVHSPNARLGKTQVRAAIDDLVLASSSGAKIEHLESSDKVGALLQLAKQRNVGRIFVARSRRTRLSFLFGRSIYSDLLTRGQGLSIDAVGFRRGH